jgi:hypothetical protein
MLKVRGLLDTTQDYFFKGSEEALEHDKIL